MALSQGVYSVWGHYLFYYIKYKCAIIPRWMQFYSFVQKINWSGRVDIRNVENFIQVSSPPEWVSCLNCRLVSTSRFTYTLIPRYSVDPRIVHLCLLQCSCIYRQKHGLWEQVSWGTLAQSHSTRDAIGQPLTQNPSSSQQVVCTDKGKTTSCWPSDPTIGAGGVNVP